MAALETGRPNNASNCLNMYKKFNAILQPIYGKLKCAYILRLYEEGRQTVLAPIPWAGNM
jgi:hypothetical protein